MAQIRVDVGGRSYPLACKDGEEALLERLAAQVNAKADLLTKQLGHVPEVRLLLMSAIMIADDLVEINAEKGAEATAAARKAPEPAGVFPEMADQALRRADAAEARADRAEAALKTAEERAAQALSEAASQIELIAAALEESAGSA